MEITKCHLCNICIYPGEKRCLISIHIFPDQETDFLFDDGCSEDCPQMEACLENETCSCEMEDVEGETFQEVQLTLCKDCQDQFLQNPSVQENLIFLDRETEVKTIH